MIELYDRAYYLEDCEGFEEFRKTCGKKLPRRLRKCLEILAPAPGEKVIDVGCGRGEISLHLAAAGADVLALDPSRDALSILGEAAAAWPREAGRTLPFRVRARGQDLPVAGDWADAVVLSDIVEHLPPAELRDLLAECRRVLRPGGRAVIHTQPNRILVRFTVPVLSRFSRLWGVRLPRDLRSEMTPGSGPEYHPGEQSSGSLRRAILESGLAIDDLWLEGSYAVHRIFGDFRPKEGILRIFRRSRVLKNLLATQIFAVVRKH